MKRGTMRIKIKLVTFVLAALLGINFSGAAQAADTLLDEVVSLKLGLGGYVIGGQLDTAQKKIAREHPVGDAYEGTYKFNDNDLNVVVDVKTDRVLALYRQVKDASKSQLKSLVVELMGHFNAPTNIAHEKILYWAFNKHGAVSEGDFNKAKDLKQTPELGIIATVKLNSEMDIAPDLKEEDKAGEDKNDPVTGSIYFMISSQPLLMEFMGAGAQ
ncbi:MAG: hypothetical protein GQ559_02515 [Desulfobulbaceae bacterium]|nr:hypothetical protein [Desulfobulbaceae bacterium]